MMPSRCGESLKCKHSNAFRFVYRGWTHTHPHLNMWTTHTAAKGKKRPKSFLILRTEGKGGRQATTLLPKGSEMHCSWSGFDFLKKIYLSDDSLIRRTSEVCGDKISINYLSNSSHAGAKCEAKIVFLLILFTLKKKECAMLTSFLTNMLKA